MECASGQVFRNCFENYEPYYTPFPSNLVFWFPNLQKNLSYQQQKTLLQDFNHNNSYISKLIIYIVSGFTLVPEDFF